MTLKSLFPVAILCALAALGGCSDHLAAPERADAGCAELSGGLTLPPGFCAEIFADKLGHVRHLVVGVDGTVYANSAPDREDGQVASGLILLQDRDGDGRADHVERPFPGQTGGTGIAIDRDRLFLEDGDHILRYRLDGATRRPMNAVERVVVGLPATGDHDSHSIALRADGSLFVNSGSATNACQIDNRQSGSPGQTPCAEKTLRAGIWRFDAAGKEQRFGPAARFASGIRNAVGLTVDGKGRVFATQHGRDQLHENWGHLYSAIRGQESPAEELIEVAAGADYGWPECYFDPRAKRLVLAPEYGGDGGKAIGPCAGRRGPVATFPAHWAPNAVIFYAGTLFPTAYRDGVFIAFHGSWNRAPGPQQGFNILFQPMKQGRASGGPILFADGFAGPERASGKADYRPTGLAIGPDGSLYISDDRQGRVWRVRYRGDKAASLIAAKAADGGLLSVSGGESDGQAKNADSAKVALGRRLYAGEIAGAPCAGCHGPAGEGTPVGPNLIDREWLWGDGGVADIRATVLKGVPRPKQFPAPMPPGGGAALTNDQADAMAAYIVSLAQ
ncbi:PQQ-dependent sugar dehydrogenase [Sphingobium cupriresistens]|uniref:Glucose dehydrogenase n=1 Tax=Sphingobium cupriresistens LL01 TaxID=1420583 RepID=A0A0J7XMJ5_9SPHN|nr:PQQ-dependent sugar dehydrogenase [Sphingobium cupriresistens]KMS53176.1 glucose dehydrogenase [Sphingobium cupriresistens LL01]